MSGTFAERMDELKKLVGERITASVTVDQVYAHYQHEHLEFHHPRGGQAKYLEQPLYDHYREYLGQYARDVLEDGGLRAMKNAAEHLSDQVELHAPVDFSDLKRSGHPVVRQGALVRYDRPPKQHRLTEAELRIKSRIRYMGLPDKLKGYIWWHVQHHTEPPPRRGR